MLIQVALLQINAVPNKSEDNLLAGEKACRQAAAKGADIALFPEMWNTGYTRCPEDPSEKEAWHAQALDANDNFVTHFRTLAKELNMAIALTYLEKWEGAPRNTLSLIDRHGHIVLTYAKVHTCDFGRDAAFSPGNDFYVCDLDTKQGSLKVGSMICYDRECPESARILMLKGAELILTPNACTMEDNRIKQLQTRAFENMVAMALTNYPAPSNNGQSIAFDGMAFDKEGTSRSMLITQAGEEEGIFLAEFDVDRLRHYRATETCGNAYRKPGRYQLLTTDEVAPPFLRPDSRR